MFNCCVAKSRESQPFIPNSLEFLQLFRMYDRFEAVYFFVQSGLESSEARVGDDRAMDSRDVGIDSRRNVDIFCGDIGELLTRELNLASSLRALETHGGAGVAAKGLFHAAWHVFADRWINIDHRRLSEPIPAQPSPAANEDAAAAAVLDAMQTLDVEAAGGRVAGYLQAGYSGDRLLHDMGRAILRDDTGHEILPTLRTVFDEWGNVSGAEADLGAGHPARAQLMVGLARYATDVRSNSDGRSAAVTAMRFAEGRTTVEMFE